MSSSALKPDTFTASFLPLRIISPAHILTKTLKALCLAAVACGGLALQAQNLIVNGSFETGNFTGWTVTATSSINPYVDVNSAGTAGTCSAVFNAGDTQPQGIISQTFATVPGAQYQVSFDYATGYGNWYNPAQTLDVLVTDSSSNLLLSQFAKSLPHPFPGQPQVASLFTSYTYTFTATSATSTLILADDPTNYTYSADAILDNVQVVQLVQPPVLALPANITRQAENSSGAEVEFRATATASVPGAVTVSYSQASDTVFPIGTTTVTVTATDAAGNKTVGSFTVTVTPKATKVEAEDDHGEKKDAKKSEKKDVKKKGDK
jgi:hypothetical protein